MSDVFGYIFNRLLTPIGDRRLGGLAYRFGIFCLLKDLNRFHALGSGWQGSECEGSAFQLMEVTLSRLKIYLQLKWPRPRSVPK